MAPSGVVPEQPPLPAQRSIPIHKHAGDRQQWQGYAKCGPKHLDNESPVVSEMQGAQPEDESSAPGVCDATMPKCELSACGWVEIYIVHLSEIPWSAPRHQKSQCTLFVSWKECSCELGVWRGLLRVMDHREQVYPWLSTSRGDGEFGRIGGRNRRETIDKRLDGLWPDKVNACERPHG